MSITLIVLLYLPRLAIRRLHSKIEFSPPSKLPCIGEDPFPTQFLAVPPPPPPSKSHVTSSCSLLAVQQAEEAVPTDADEVDGEDAVVEGHELEVDELDEGPEGVVGGEGGDVALGQLVRRAAALHHRHRRQEHPDERRREQQLVRRHARQDRPVRAPQVHVPLQQPEPRRCRRPEYHCVCARGRRKKRPASSDRKDLLCWRFGGEGNSPPP